MSSVSNNLSGKVVNFFSSEKYKYSPASKVPGLNAIVGAFRMLAGFFQVIAGDPWNRAVHDIFNGLGEITWVLPIAQYFYLQNEEDKKNYAQLT